MDSNPNDNRLALDGAERQELSVREHEILRLLATGVSNKQIAQELFISPNTVKVHLRNIFSKLGVASRTEATLYAMQAGLVDMPLPANGNGAAAGAVLDANLDSAPAIDIASVARNRRTRALVLAGGALIVVLAVLLGVSLYRRPAASTLSAPSATPRWHDKTQLPAARSGLAAAAYENQVYAIGGEGPAGVSAVVERYDPASNAWTTLSSMPVPAADIAGAVIGGLIFVPGGRLASGAITSTLEVYNPRQDSWEQRSPMPATLSGYALAAYEGKLYVFGGWDGHRYVDSVYDYDPISDKWTTHDPMATARGFAAAAAAAGKIFVVGGTDGEQELALNTAFSPDAEASGEPAWETHTPLPAGRSKFAMASLADILHIIGGNGAGDPPVALAYSPQVDIWEQLETPPLSGWTQLGVAAVGTNLYAFGGLARGAPIAGQWTYQALYTIAIPVVH
jgi:DNA-binding CsgD family transcriptional regulator/N-acetylneuraminic acid mutarotase